MLHFEIDRQRGVPAYRQVMDQVKYYVAAEVLKPNDVLPSIRDLAKYLTVNPTTVVKAYSELEHDGVIVRKQGKGAFIAENAKQLSGVDLADSLKELVRHVVVESRQMGASEKDVLDTIKQIFKEMKS